MKIEMNEVEIKFKPEERDLIIDHTFAGPDLTKRLQIAEVEANHTDDKKTGKKLDRLFERLSRILYKSIEYDDEDE